jgi:hypothetical protein
MEGGSRMEGTPMIGKSATPTTEAGRSLLATLAGRYGYSPFWPSILAIEREAAAAERAAIRAAVIEMRTQPYSIPRLDGVLALLDSRDARDARNPSPSEPATEL